MTNDQKYLDIWNRKNQTLSNGSKLIRVYGNVYDFFPGRYGWSTPCRLKINKQTTGLTGIRSKAATLISGNIPSPALLDLILQEMVI